MCWLNCINKLQAFPLSHIISFFHFRQKLLLLIGQQKPLGKESPARRTLLEFSRLNNLVAFRATRGFLRHIVNINKSAWKTIHFRME